jgi:TetR/AcrR family tetracycline transcriptional repressor
MLPCQVKSGKEARRSVHPGLDPDVVARAGLDLLDRVGFDDFSMRRLAATLGVQNPALYWHFRDKQELVDRMAQALLASGFASDDALPEPTSWEERLLRLARSLRRAMQSRRDGARLIAAADLSQGNELLGRLDRTVAALVVDGFRGREALGGILTLIHYTMGETFEEQTDPRPDAPILSKARARQLPALAAVIAEMGTTPPRPDARFELGARLILEGIRAHHSCPPEHEPRRTRRR